ncbi:hypothetical protein K440DRAFT_614038 [Wilcoxina mikolae CBS 423.85]|nr:hypothetical protein K440DRAFT_614038 [Wilcoxina mikolae CBS 423.85]
MRRWMRDDSGVGGSVGREVLGGNSRRRLGGLRRIFCVAAYTLRSQSGSVLFLREDVGFAGSRFLERPLERSRVFGRGELLTGVSSSVGPLAVHLNVNMVAQRKHKYLMNPRNHTRQFQSRAS